MHKSKTVHLLAKFTAAELESLDRMLQNPDYNRRPEVLRLYRFICSALPDKKGSLQLKAAVNVLPPDRKGTEAQVRHCLSYLNQLIEQFLVLRHTLQPSPDYYLALLKCLRAYNAPKHQKAAYRKLKAFLPDTSLPSVNHYRLNYDVELAIYEDSVNQQRTDPKNLQELNDSLDLSYLTAKLKDCCLALSHQAVVEVNYNTGLLPFALEYLSQNPALLSREPVLGIYYYYFKAATQEDGVPHFSRMRQLMAKFGHQLETEEQRTIYLLAINYGIRQFNSGQSDYLRPVFDLYKEALELELLFERQQLSPFAYKNIAGIAIRLKEFSWVKDFISRYQNKLLPRYRKDYVAYVQAKWHYEQQQYGPALDYLNQVKFTDRFLSLDAKVMLMKIFYEQGELDVLDAFLTSTQRFLQRQNLMSYHKQNYANTIYYLRKLLSLNRYDKQQVDRLRKRIMEVSPLGEKEWLLGVL